jgi:hypothetical protein
VEKRSVYSVFSLTTVRKEHKRLQEAAQEVRSVRGY